MIPLSVIVAALSAGLLAMLTLRAFYSAQPRGQLLATRSAEQAILFLALILLATAGIEGINGYAACQGGIEAPLICENLPALLVNYLLWISFMLFLVAVFAGTPMIALLVVAEAVVRRNRYKASVR